ncbi:MAG: hypothetical protein ACI95X_002631 [Paraglaciecola sp.]|jgi:hypothetical protein
MLARWRPAALVGWGGGPLHNIAYDLVLEDWARAQTDAPGRGDGIGLFRSPTAKCYHGGGFRWHALSSFYPSVIYVPLSNKSAE